MLIEILNPISVNNYLAAPGSRKQLPIFIMNVGLISNERNIPPQIITPTPKNNENMTNVSAPKIFPINK